MVKEAIKKRKICKNYRYFLIYLKVTRKVEIDENMFY